MGVDSLLPALGAGKMCNESRVKNQDLVIGGLDLGEICTQLPTQL